MAQAMNQQQAREVFNQTLIGETDPERIAKVELLREYFCNDEFRTALAAEVARINAA